MELKVPVTEVRAEELGRMDEWLNELMKTYVIGGERLENWLGTSHIRFYTGVWSSGGICSFRQRKEGN